MGVEYGHWFLVRDLAWLPSSDSSTRIVGALERWGLGGEFVVGDFDDGTPGRLEGAFDITSVGLLQDVTVLPANALVQRIGSVQGEAAHRVMGDSRYETVPPEDQYIQHLCIILGSHYRVFDAFRTGYAAVTNPAEDEMGYPIQPVERFDRWHATELTVSSGLRRWASVKTATRIFYPSPPAVAAPTVSFTWTMAATAPSEFGGCFRSGLGLHCGKSLINGLNGPEPLINRDFFSDMQDAFDTDLVEAGFIS